MSEGSRPWWALMPAPKSPSPTDIGAECGHTRDRHDALGKCLIFEADRAIGGYEGYDAENPNGVTLESTGHYHRETCFCPRETNWHIAGLPYDFNWDSLEKTNWRDPNARRTPGGTYVWWVETE